MKITIKLTKAEKKQWKEQKTVAWFNVGSVRANLNCNGDPTYTGSSLGVKVLKEIYKQLKEFEK